LLVDRAYVNVCCPQTVDDFVQCTVGIPLIEQIPNGCPRPEFLRQVSPWRTGSQYPQNTINNRSPITRRPASLGRCWKNVCNALPLIIRESMSNHNYALRGELEASGHSLRQNSPAAKEQFSDKA
jgi:hypothetical protein